MKNPFSSLLKMLPAAACALALAGCGRSNTPELASGRFFRLLNEGHYRQAYEEASFQLQTQMGEGNFEAIARDTKLGDYGTADWKPVPQTIPEEARLTTEVPTTVGGKNKLELVFLHQQGVWRFSTLLISDPERKGNVIDLFSRIGKGVSFGEAFYRKMPTDAQLKELVNDTMRKFNEGLHKRNFVDFYKDTSQLWQSQASQEKVSKAFQAFIDAGITLDNIKDMQFVLDEPIRYNAEGALLVNGYYPTRPDRVIFNLKYTFELPKWKLLGITVSIKP